MKTVTIGKKVACLSLVLCASGCANIKPTYNQPLSHANKLVKTDIKASVHKHSAVPKKPNTIKTVIQSTKPVKKNDELLLVLTFSGGGKRAAALSYGVLKALKDVPFNTNSSLLEQVDYISSVSGGSYTAAYYGLFGEKIFSQYKKDYLNKEIRSSLLKLASKDASRLASDYFHRSDLAAEYYGDHIFKNKTFADMLPYSPQIIVNTTDLATGNSFAFSQQDMNVLCSDISEYPVSRAVSASSAVPGAFSPIVLKNYADCETKKTYQKQPSVIVSDTEQKFLQRRKFLDAKRYPYLHLIDGGISDNLGVRSAVRHIFNDDIQNTHSKITDKLNNDTLKKAKRVVFIVVNASDDINPRIGQSSLEPSIEDVINATTTIQLNRYNADTLDLLKLKFDTWSKQLQQKCTHHAKATHTSQQCSNIAFDVVEINLKQLPEELAKETSLYQTALDLPKKQIDTLIDAGYYLLNNSLAFEQVRQDLTNTN